MMTMRPPKLKRYFFYTSIENVGRVKTNIHCSLVVSAAAAAVSVAESVSILFVWDSLFSYWYCLYHYWCSFVLHCAFLFGVLLSMKAAPWKIESKVDTKVSSY